jgi:hypothetical protein
MKTFHYFGCFAAGLFFATSRGQTFQNLDFEQASISVPPPGQLSTSAALPGWNVYLNGSPSSTIYYDNIALDQWDVSIHDSKTFYSTPIAGLFSVLLQGGRNGLNQTGSADIAQLGSIDTTSHSILFSAKLVSSVPSVPGPILNVSFKGQPLPIFALAASQTFTTYGADVSAFSGQTGELRFSSPYGSWAYLDDIRFSSQVIPEPSTFALLAAGTVILRAAFNRRRK